jgi:hypothetical protein
VLDRHDLATGYMSFMEQPIVAGRLWTRDEQGFVAPANTNRWERR